MPTLAIGDIHGNSAALADLIHQFLPELMPEDYIVFLARVYLAYGRPLVPLLGNMTVNKGDAAIP